MASSGPRGTPPNRYGDRSESDYSKQRKRSFYPGRRGADAAPIIGNNSGGRVHDNSSISLESNYSGGRGRYGAGTGPNLASRNFNGSGMREGRNSYGSYNGIKNSYLSYGSSPYYSGYNNYGGFGGRGDYSSGSSSHYGSRGDNWRNDRTKSYGDSRLSGTKPSVSSSYNTRPSLSPESASVSANTTGSEYRQDKYESYPNESSGGKWKGPYSPAKPSLTRSAFSSPGYRPHSSRDRPKSSYNGNPSTSSKRTSSYYFSRQPYSSSVENKSFHRQQSEKYPNRSYSPQYAPPATNDTFTTESATSAASSEQPFTVKNIEENIQANEQTQTGLKKPLNSEGEMFENFGQPSDGSTLHKEIKAETLASKPLVNISQMTPPCEGDTDKSLSSFAIQKSPLEVNDSEEYQSNTKLEDSETIMYTDGCNYPQNYMDTKFNELKSEFSQLKDESEKNHLKYSLVSPIVNLKEYPFFRDNLNAYACKHEKLCGYLKSKEKAIYLKRLKLCKEYVSKSQISDLKRSMMEEQLELLHSMNDDFRKELDSIDIHMRVDTAESDSTAYLNNGISTSGVSRRNRRHGDLVTTEAEFQEILKSLGKEQEEDPILKAQKGAATIPDFILDPIEREKVKYMNSNNFVEDKVRWTARLKSDFQNNFSPAEHSLFCEGFCMYPKRFGAISRHMGGLRMPEECVVHYYITKKNVNYKQLLINYKKKVSKRVSRRKSLKGRSSSLLALQGESDVSETPENGKNIVSRLDAELNLLAGNNIDNELNIVTNDEREKHRLESDIDSAHNGKKIKLDESTDIYNLNGATSSTLTLGTPQSVEVDIKNSTASTGHESGSNEERIRSSKRSVNSYWNASESSMFPKLLMKHGTNWDLIANELSTKSSIMVRNYFQKNAEKQNWLKFVAILRGEESANEVADDSLAISEVSAEHLNGNLGYGTAGTKEVTERNGLPVGNEISENGFVTNENIPKENDPVLKVHPKHSITNLLVSESSTSEV